jgi:predicted GH43/DUF377 family glycosyl hydrolase
MRGQSHLTAARSKKGVSNWEIDKEPTLLPDTENYPEELWGYERFGDVGYVVFSCGHVVEPDADTLRIYYGAADHCTALGITRISSLLDWLDTRRLGKG